MSSTYIVPVGRRRAEILPIGAGGTQDGEAISMGCAQVGNKAVSAERACNVLIEQNRLTFGRPG